LASSSGGIASAHTIAFRERKLVVRDVEDFLVDRVWGQLDPHALGRAEISLVFFDVEHVEIADVDSRPLDR
jgi:hypothetical protein